MRNVDRRIALANQVGHARRAALSQAGADRLFQPERGMGQLGRPAGAHEFRAAAGRNKVPGVKVEAADATVLGSAEFQKR